MFDENCETTSKSKGSYVGCKLFKSTKQISEIEREMVQFVGISQNLRIFGGN
jgi:hypothetical protein